MPPTAPVSRSAGSEIRASPFHARRPDNFSYSDPALPASPSIHARPKKTSGPGVPISRHEAFQVLPVPGRLLVINYFANRRSRVAGVLPRTRDGEHSNHAHQQKQIPHMPSTGIQFRITPAKSAAI